MVSMDDAHVGRGAIGSCFFYRLGFSVGLDESHRRCHPLGSLDCFVARDEQTLQIDC